MIEFLPEDVRRGLEAAQKRALRKGSHLSVHVGDESWPILRLGETGFSVDAERIPPLRGFVDIYDGPRHLMQALIIAVAEENGEMTYEFKRETVIHKGPVLDYAVETPAPDGYLPSPL